MSSSKYATGIMISGEKLGTSVNRNIAGNQTNRESLMILIGPNLSPKRPPMYVMKIPILKNTVNAKLPCSGLVPSSRVQKIGMNALITRKFTDWLRMIMNKIPKYFQ
jgi:hypothetical protein